MTVAGLVGLTDTAVASATSNPGTGDTGFFTFVPSTPSAGARVNVASGDLFVTAHDLVDSDANYHVVVDRFYNSLDGEMRRALSPRWRFSAGPDVVLVDHGATVEVTGPTGYVITFTGTGGGAYAAPAGFDGALVKTASGWSLTRNAEHDQYQFDGNGQMTGAIDSAGRRFTVQTTSANGATILGSYGTPDGRRVNLSYNGDATVRELDDPSSTHHAYAYSAYQTGYLSSYDDGTGSHTAYGYDENGRLDLIHAADGTTVSAGYDTQGRVVVYSATAPGGSPQITQFRYGDHETGVTGPDGHLTVYTWDDDYRVTGTQTSTTPPPPPTDLAINYNADREGTEFGWIGHGGDGGHDEFRYAVNGASASDWTAPPTDLDRFGDDTQPGDSVTLEVRTIDRYGNVSSIASRTATLVDPEGDSGAEAKQAAADSGDDVMRRKWLDDHCYRSSSVYAYPFPAGPQDLSVSVAKYNTPDCRSTGHGSDAAEDAAPVPSGQGSLPPSYRGETAYSSAFHSNVLLKQNAAAGNRRAWPMTNSYNDVFAWVEQIRPDVSDKNHDTFAVYDASGTLDASHMIGTVDRNSDAQLLIQGRACQYSDSLEQKHVLVEVNHADYGMGPHAYADPAQGPGRVYLGLRGFLAADAFSTLAGKGHYEGDDVASIARDYDIGCTQHQLGGMRSPTDPESGAVLPATGGLNPLFQTDDHYQGEQGGSPGEIGGGNRYSNYNGWPDPNESYYYLDATNSFKQSFSPGVGAQNAALPQQVKIMANTTGVHNGGIVRAIVPVAAHYTEYDHFDYHDPDTVCVKREAIQQPPEVRWSAQWAFVHIDDARGHRTIQGWVPHRATPPTAAACATPGDAYPGGEAAAP